MDDKAQTDEFKGKPVSIGYFIVDRNNQLWRKIKRFFHKHTWMWEYRSHTKIQFCASCGAHGREEYK